MKKILFLTNMFPSKTNPTYGIFVHKTYQWLCESHSVDLVKICKDTNILKKTFDYIIFYMKSILKGVFFHYDCVYAHYISHCAFPIRIIKMIHRNKIIIGNIHGEDVFSEYEKYKKNRKKAEVFLKHCDYIIAPSEYFKRRLSEEYAFSKQKIFVSPSGGVDTTFFVPKDKKNCKEKLGLNTSKRHIGMVSRIEEGKGWDTFISAAAMIPYEDVEFVIVGSGTQDKDVKKMIQEQNMQDKIIRFPAATHDELVDLYGTFDIFCFPTRRDAESLGLVGIEGMSCGLSCIISDIPGPSSYCTEDNCLRFEAGNAYQLRDKMIELLGMNESEVQFMRECARKTALQYDCELVRQKFLLFFDKI